MESFEFDFIESDDAMVWAKAFVNIVQANPGLLIPGADAEGFMCGWFANAMMRGEASRTKKIQSKIDQVNREIRAVSYYISTHCHRNPSRAMVLETPLEVELEEQMSADRAMLGFVREHLVRLESDDIVSSGQL
jgi:hypothetical protein